MKFIRDTYRPGEDRLVYTAVDKGTNVVAARAYSPSHRAKHKDCQTLKPFKLEPGIFVLDFDFREVGNYIFVLEEDGIVQTVLNAKVYA